MEENKIIIRKGTFRTINRLQGLVSALLLVGLFFLAVIFVLSFINFGEEINMLLRRAAAVCIVMEGAFAAVRVIMSFGREFSYEANESDFVVTDNNNGEKEYYYYSDVSSVNYTAISSGNRITGYLVEIATGMRTVKYRYRFPANADDLSTAATPFYLLEVNAGLREPEVEVMNSEQIMERFENMQYQQDLEKTRAKRKKGDDGYANEKLLMASVEKERQRALEKKKASEAQDEVTENDNEE